MTDTSHSLFVARGRELRWLSGSLKPSQCEAGWRQARHGHHTGRGHGAVAPRAALWCLKRECTVSGHFMNGEYTGETLTCASNSAWEGAWAQPHPWPPQVGAVPRSWDTGAGCAACPPVPCTLGSGPGCGVGAGPLVPVPCTGGAGDQSHQGRPPSHSLHLCRETDKCSLKGRPSFTLASFLISRPGGELAGGGGNLIRAPLWDMVDFSELCLCVICDSGPAWMGGQLWGRPWGLAFLHQVRGCRKVRAHRIFMPRPSDRQHSVHLRDGCLKKGLRDLVLVTLTAPAGVGKGHVQQPPSRESGCPVQER